ncbi:MAG: ubiquinol-cytochrome C chaperone family protein [Parvularculaceae bacterium]
MRLFKKDKVRESAAELYEDIVHQARKEAFYLDHGIPDTVAGRFDSIALHMFLVLDRLKNQGEQAELFSQRLFDAMFRNMDDSLRELGVGDLSVGKKVRHLAEAFYGRIGAYEKALLSDDPKPQLAAAIAKNILGAPEETPAEADTLADYAIAAKAKLAATSLERLLAGIVHFPQISTTKI